MSCHRYADNHVPSVRFSHALLVRFMPTYQPEKKEKWLDTMRSDGEDNKQNDKGSYRRPNRTAAPLSANGFEIHPQHQPRSSVPDHVMSCHVIVMPITMSQASVRISLHYFC